MKTSETSASADDSRVHALHIWINTIQQRLPSRCGHVYDLIRSSMNQSLIYFTSFHIIDFYYTCAWMTCQILHNVLYLFDAFLYVYADRLSTSIFISNVLCDISPKKMALN